MMPSRRASEALPQDLTQLLLCAREGDRRALEELIGRYQWRIAKFVIAQTGGDCHYEDVCQTIFVKMVLALPRLRDVERFEPWLFQIARNGCRDYLRSRQGWRRLFLPFDQTHEAVAAPQSEGSDERAARMAEGIEQLPEGQRHLLKLSLEGKKSYEELADLSNSSVPAVKSRLHRARESLRGILFAGDAK
jgi:RNA polymerase sigma-70 factor (ECF subfamily)